MVLVLFTLMLASCREAKETTVPADIVYETIDDVEVIPADKKSDHKPLTLVITNLRTATDPVIVSLYNSEKDFLQNKGSLKQYHFIPNKKKLTAQITDRDYGEYAIAAFQDENQSGKMDKNVLGIPKEAWCLSNNIKPKLKAPNYKDCIFEYDAKSNTISMKMVW
jgi:uncharacterized protein (DUF2141 family)